MGLENGPKREKKGGEKRIKKGRLWGWARGPIRPDLGAQEGGRRGPKREEKGCPEKGPKTGWHRHRSGRAFPWIPGLLRDGRRPVRA